LIPRGLKTLELKNVETLKPINISKLWYFKTLKPRFLETSNAGAYIEFLPVTAARICYLGKKLEYVQLFSGRKFEVSQENKKKNEKNNK
jgi:hypothetical protein